MTQKPLKHPWKPGNLLTIKNTQLFYLVISVQQDPKYPELNSVKLLDHNGIVTHFTIGLRVFEESIYQVVEL